METLRKVSLPLILIISVLLGVVLSALYSNYSSDFKDAFFRPSKEEIDETIYFPPDNYTFTDGSSGQWLYRVIQMRVVEYKSDGGLNYVVGEYLPYNDDELGMKRVKVLLTRNQDWEDPFTGLRTEDFEEVVTDKILLQDTFDVTTIKFWNRSMVDLEIFKESFKPGDILPMAIPFAYPDDAQIENILTEELCGVEMYVRSCLLTRVWESVSSNLENFWAARDLSVEENFYIVPYSFSPYVLTQTEIDRLWQ